MARLRRDPKAYYEVLNLQPGASPSEVKLAYTFLKNACVRDPRLEKDRIEEAYDFLQDPTQKDDYDIAVVLATSPRNRSTNLGVIVVVALLLFAGFVFPGFLRPGPEPFMTGQELVSNARKTPLGEVIREEEGHRFPNGLTGPAYLVRGEDGTERWYPKSDIEAHYSTGGN